MTYSVSRISAIALRRGRFCVLVPSFRRVRGFVRGAGAHAKRALRGSRTPCARNDNDRGGAFA